MPNLPWRIAFPCFLLLIAIGLVGGPRLVGAASAPAASPASLAQVLDQAFAAHRVDGAFVAFDEGTATWFRHGSAEALGRHRPASTFKVPNALIALETGAVPDEHTVLPWDGAEHRIEAWNRDHDLASAMEHSVLWYYQELARRAGPGAMRSWLDRLGYGSRTMGEQLDRFWLDGSLAISPEEQVSFLRRLRTGALPASQAHQATVRRILRRDWRGCRVHTKTGWAIDGTSHHGWYVGWIDRRDGAQVFALYVRGEGEGFPMWTTRPAILDAALQAMASARGCTPADEGLPGFGPLPS